MQLDVPRNKNLKQNHCQVLQQNKLISQMQFRFPNNKLQSFLASGVERGENEFEYY